MQNFYTLFLLSLKCIPVVFGSLLTMPIVGTGTSAYCFWDGFYILLYDKAFVCNGKLGCMQCITRIVYVDKALISAGREASFQRKGGSQVRWV